MYLVSLIAKCDKASLYQSKLRSFEFVFLKSFAFLGKKVELQLVYNHTVFLTVQNFNIKAMMTLRLKHFHSDHLFYYTTYNRQRKSLLRSSALLSKNPVPYVHITNITYCLFALDFGQWRSQYGARGQSAPLTATKKC